MGWLHRTGWTRKDWVTDLTATVYYEGTTTRSLRHCLRGNVLWHVRERVWEDASHPSQRWLACDLLRPDADGWGVKEMGEECGPYYLTCPLSYLDMVPETNAEWRGWVREEHARKLAARRGARAQ